ncbi:hypothetical protein ACW9HD_37395 [Nocardia gipuzkoensis]
MMQEAHPHTGQPHAAGSAPVAPTALPIPPVAMAATQQPEPQAQPDPATRWWHRVRTSLGTIAATTTICLATGALQQLGAHLIEWLW